MDEGCYTSFVTSTLRQLPLGWGGMGYACRTHEGDGKFVKNVRRKVWKAYGRIPEGNIIRSSGKNWSPTFLWYNTVGIANKKLWGTNRHTLWSLLMHESRCMSLKKRFEIKFKCICLWNETLYRRTWLYYHAQVGFTQSELWKSLSEGS
jgi:hypothetical protein